MKVDMSPLHQTQVVFTSSRMRHFKDVDRCGRRLTGRPNKRQEGGRLVHAD